MGLGKRIKAERERLGLSQAAFAALVGKSRKSQIRWEQDETSPDSDALNVWKENGVDVEFILTGHDRAFREALQDVRSAVVQAEGDDAQTLAVSQVAAYNRIREARLREEEAEVLDGYRSCSRDDQQRIRDFVNRLRPDKQSGGGIVNKSRKRAAGSVK